jgi:23S rRNA (guanine2445-N2)-methyltransferase / 23S rRNA (guanine2069-N7)-methyltransferase
VQIGSFEAHDFGQLFDGVAALAWEEWMPPDAAFPVSGRSHKSQLSSVPACQRMTKRAIVERLRKAHGADELPETGAPVPAAIELFDNVAYLLIDTSGVGLHKRGYRRLAKAGQLRETLAAAMVLLSVWKPDRPLVDPFCGTGTLAIEAAMIGRQMAPGLRRRFVSEEWGAIDASIWEQARQSAQGRLLAELAERIVATDVDPEALSLARYHAEQAGVDADIHFQQREFRELLSSRKYGCVVTNPPYGMRVGDEREATELYRDMPLVLRRLPTWSHFVLTARDDFEQLIGQQATRRRKLYNGQIRCTLYQFLGPKPPSMQRDRPLVEHDEHDEHDEQPRAPQQPTAATPVFGGLPQDIDRQIEDFANRLAKRARHLRRWPSRRGVDCYRLYDRDIPEIPLAIDRYADTLHIAEYVRPHDRTPAQHADWLDRMARVAADALKVDRKLVFVKQRRRQKGNLQYQKFGDSSITRVVTEGDLRFRVNLTDYLDTGLFLDHRITRQKVMAEAAGKRFLNLFAYTGSFTVAAAKGGAAQTTTVDLSNTYLDWAADNLELNGFAASGDHQLVRADALDFVGSLPREPLFELAVVDPPTYSNSKRLDDDWDTQQHHAELLGALAARMSPGGVVYFSNNFRRFKLAESELGMYAIREISRQTVPEDFRNERIHRCWRLVAKST